MFSLWSWSLGGRLVQGGAHLKTKRSHRDLQWVSGELAPSVSTKPRISLSVHSSGFVFLRYFFFFFAWLCVWFSRCSWTWLQTGSTVSVSQGRVLSKSHWFCILHFPIAPLSQAYLCFLMSLLLMNMWLYVQQSKGKRVKLGRSTTVSTLVLVHLVL